MFIGTKKFNNKGKNIEVNFSEDGSIEIYEEDDPGATGFVFDNKKEFIYFINKITDIMEDLEKGVVS